MNELVAIFFDVDDTLYNQVQPFKTAYIEIFGEAEDEKINGIFDVTRKFGDIVFAPSQKEAISMEEMYIYRIFNGFRQYGMELGREDCLLFQKIYAKAQKNIYLDGEMKKILSYCKENADLGIITNGPSSHQRNKLNALNAWEWISEDKVFISAEVGAMKPDPRIFKCAEQKAKLTGEKYYVGDHYGNDIVGARRAGWKQIWYNHRNKEIPQGGKTPDFEVRSAAELFAVLKVILGK